MGSAVVKDLRNRRTLAGNINRLRAEHPLTQNRLAQISGVNPKQIDSLLVPRTVVDWTVWPT